MDSGLSIVLAIFSLIPAIIFIVIFRVIIMILQRGKNKLTEDFHEEEFDDSRNIYEDRRSDPNSFINQVKKIIKEETENKDKKENKNILIDKNPKIKNIKDKDHKISKKELKEKISENRKVKEIKGSNRNSDITKKFKITDSDFIKECESNEVIYEDEGSNENINEDDFLNFNEEDLTKIQIYKEIFDKPLSLR